MPPRFCPGPCSLHAVHRLRGESDVSMTGISVAMMWRMIGTRAVPPSILTASRRLLDEAHGVLHCIADAGVIGTEGHVDDQKRVAHGPAHGPGVMQHLVHGDRQRSVVAEHDLGKASLLRG